MHGWSVSSRTRLRPPVVVDDVRQLTAIVLGNAPIRDLAFDLFDNGLPGAMRFRALVLLTVRVGEDGSRHRWPAMVQCKKIFFPWSCSK